MRCEAIPSGSVRLADVRVARLFREQTCPDRCSHREQTALAVHSEAKDACFAYAYAYVGRLRGAA
jgi:hypothetical protein